MKSRVFEGIEYPLRPYFAMEGIVGAGKSTQMKLLLPFLVAEFPRHEIIFTHEPGHSEIADVIRNTVQVREFTEAMTWLCEASLYTSSRAQTLPTIVGPALEQGKIVGGDRSAITSCSYQGYGRELGIERILAINRPVVGNLWPSKVIVIDTPMNLALARAQDKLGDKFERLGEDFFHKARQGYYEMANRNKWVFDVIDGAGTEEEVQKRVRLSVVNFLRREVGLE